MEQVLVFLFGFDVSLLVIQPLSGNLVMAEKVRLLHAAHADFRARGKVLVQRRSAGLCRTDYEKVCSSSHSIRCLNKPVLEVGVQ
jgi:hypothetical protein